MKCETNRILGIGLWNTKCLKSCIQSMKQSAKHTPAIDGILTVWHVEGWTEWPPRVPDLGHWIFECAMSYSLLNSHVSSMARLSRCQYWMKHKQSDTMWIYQHDSYGVSHNICLLPLSSIYPYKWNTIYLFLHTTGNQQDATCLFPLCQMFINEINNTLTDLYFHSNQHNTA